MEDRASEGTWMPVFVVVPGMRTVTASVDEPDAPARETAVEDYRQRVGTATVLANGDISVELFAVPTQGWLLLCKPGPGDRRSPWRGE
jgi:hypothetical protein